MSKTEKEAKKIGQKQPTPRQQWDHEKEQVAEYKSRHGERQADDRITRLPKHLENSSLATSEDLPPVPDGLGGVPR